MLCLGVALTAAHGQTADSLQTDTMHDINEVVVTGSRKETSIRHLSQTVSVVGRQQIENTLQSTVMTALNEDVPGLFVTQRGTIGYGVSGGAAGNISMRGLSGSQGRLMVMIDGHPQYAGIFGHPISDSYQSFMTERVEVLRGPASVLYGSNAMGGVVNIVTRKMDDDGIKTNVRLSEGSHNTLESEITNRIRYGNFSSVASLSYNSTDGHRPRMDFEQYGGYAKLKYDFSNNLRVRADVDITHFEAETPGAADAPLSDAEQRITRGMTSAAIENTFAGTSGTLSFFYNWGNHWINDGYIASQGAKPRPERFLSEDNMMGISAYQSFTPTAVSVLTVGVDWFRYGGKAWNEFIEGPKEGTTADLVDKHCDEAAAYIEVRQGISRWVTVNAGLRADHHSAIGTEWVPQAGIAFHMPRNMELKASASKGFRYPILREMYMFPPQNPDLKPEKMWNYEVAMSQSLLGGNLTYGINAFYIDGENLIMTLPNPNGSGKLNLNSGKIENMGVELQAMVRVCQHLAFNGNYSYLDMKNPVVGAPEHKLNINASYARQRWSLTTGIQHVAGLYTQTEPNITERFTLWNVRAQADVTKWLTLWARGENLLGQAYEINAGYTMPKATATAGMTLNF